MELIDLNFTEKKLITHVQVIEGLTNDIGTMHGGAVAAFIQLLPFLLLKGVDDRNFDSVDFYFEIYSPMYFNSVVRIEATCVKQGRALSFTKTNFLNERGDSLAVGFHVFSVSQNQSSL